MRRPLLLLPLLLTIPACDFYTSAVPLGEVGAAPFDEALLGAWVEADDSPADEPWVVTRAGEHEYLITGVFAPRPDTGLVSKLGPRGRSGPDTMQFRAHISVLGNVRFLNLRALDTAQDTLGPYFFIRYALRGDEARMRVLGADTTAMPVKLGQFTTSEALRAAVLARLNDPSLFGEEGVMRRKLRR